MDAWAVTAVVIVLGALVLDGTRAYRALPALLNRLRRPSTGRPQSLRVDSAGLPPAPTNRLGFAGRERESRHGERS